MYKKRLLILPVLFVVFFAGNLHAQESMIPDIRLDYLQKLIDTAKKYYPEVKVRATQTAIAQTTYHQAQTSWFDIITPSYLYNPSQSTNLVTPIAANSYQLAITINIGNIIAKPFIIHNANQAVKVARLQQDEYNLSIEAQVKRLYYTYVMAQANLRALTKSVQDAQTNADQLKHKYEMVETTLVEYSAAQNILYTQTSNKLLGELAFFNAKVGLEEIVGKRLEDIK
ncbi:MAG: TolC family protein [Bacteroidota bacterium]